MRLALFCLAWACGACATPPPGEEPQDCGSFSFATVFNCSKDGNARGKCVNGALVYERCPRGCLRKPLGEDDVCMGTSHTFSCTETFGTTPMEDGDYYATSFGCWTDADGKVHTDAADNCIPACLNQAKSSGLCAGMSGPECEKSVNWYAADAARYGCLARLRVTNPKNGKSVVVVALDRGPACSVEHRVSRGVMDMSGRATRYLFGGDRGAVDRALVHVVEVDKATPLGPAE